jgi:undecaprenyl-diphosphatase
MLLRFKIMKYFCLLAGGLLLSGLLSIQDSEISQFIYNHRSEVATNFLQNITQLNNSGFNMLSFLIILMYLLFKHQDYYIKTFLVNCAGSVILSPLLKNLLMRPRPDITNRLIEASGYSWPSGHAIASVTIWGFCGWYLSQRYKNKLLPLIASLLIGLVAFSRVYLGVHYMSDVVAGVTIGLTWLLYSINVSKVKT